ncbi:MAG: histidine kinase dimerization/phospho-acceptor domain-containing protein, partial [Dehalococcoidia bacterium]|nr:histidine kinase dimerization/phospho-acceptor domain-containing protein [Dehalococcoidia bacterium]
MFRPTLENKILGLVIAAVGICLTLFVFLDIQDQTRVLLEQDDAEVNVLASAVVTSIQNIMLSGKGDFAYQLVENMRKISKIERLHVFNTQGNEVFVNQPSNTPNVEEKFLILEVVRSGLPYQYHKTIGGKDYLTQLKPLPNDAPCQQCHGHNEEIRGVVSVSTSMEQVEEQIRHTQVRMLIATLLAFAAITIAVRILIRMTVVNPLGTVVAAMKEVALGNLTKTVRRDSKDEIGDLVDNFNVMTQHLRESRGSLQRSNEDLAANSQELLQVNHELQLRLEEVSALSTVASAISHSFDLTSTLDSALTKILDILQAEEGSIYLLDEEKGDLLLQVSRTAQGGRADGPGSKLLTALIKQKTELFEPSVIDIEDTSGDDGIPVPLSAAMVPLQSKERLLGIMSVLAKQENPISTDKARLLMAIGNQLGVAIENARLLHEASEVKVLRELDGLKSEFVARASHELRTPVTSIRGYAETLLRDDIKLTPELRHEFIDGISRTSDRLARLIEDLLNLSKMEAGRMEFDIEPFSLMPLLRDVVQRFRPQNPRHSFIITLAKGFPRVLADRERLDNVLTNLISNAVAYSPSGGDIRIEGHAENHEAIITVSDQGVGIPPEEIQHVFQRYYRVDNIATRPVGGTGLGLHICKS